MTRLVNWYPEVVGKPTRYRAKATWSDGTFFHSKGELRRWEELKLLEKAGEIWQLERQTPYTLHVMAKHTGLLVKIGMFTPDFRYLERSGEVVVEDFKSPASAKDEAYRLRKRMFEAEYGLQVRETMRTRR